MSVAALSRFVPAPTVVVGLTAARLPVRVGPIRGRFLADPRKRNWYGVDLTDVVHSAKKLGMTPDAMRAALRAAPWAQPNSL